MKKYVLAFGVLSLFLLSVIVVQGTEDTSWGKVKGQVKVKPAGKKGGIPAKADKVGNLGWARSGSINRYSSITPVLRNSRRNTLLCLYLSGLMNT